MATLETDALAAQSSADVAGLAALWSSTWSASCVTLVEPMHVLSLRHRAGHGSTALAAVLASHGLPALPKPGRSSGDKPLLVWCRPDETTLLTTDAMQSAALLAALRPGAGALAFALDVSSGTLVVMLEGNEVDALLSRLVDAHSSPRAAGQASRMRLADIAVTLWRETPDRVGLLVDRANAQYVVRWLNYAAEVAPRN